MIETITTVDAEIVVPLDRAEAKRLDQRIRLLVGSINDNIAKLHDLVDEAKRGDVHVALGYHSWTAYLADVFTVTVRLDREQRRELVGYLSGEGMSQRAIADVVGASKNTVTNDLRHVSHIGTAEADRVVDVPAGGDAGLAVKLADAIQRPPSTPVTGLDGKTYRPQPKSSRKPGRTRSSEEPVPGDPDVLAELVKTVTACAVGAQFVDPGSVDRDVLIQHVAAIRDGLDAIHDAVDRWAVDE